MTFILRIFYYIKKSENILIYDIQNCYGFKTLLGVRFHNIDAFIQIYDGNKYLALLSRTWFDEICDRIKYLVSERSGITDSIHLIFATIRIGSYNSLPIEKILTFHVL